MVREGLNKWAMPPCISPTSEVTLRTLSPDLRLVQCFLRFAIALAVLITLSGAGDAVLAHGDAHGANKTTAVVSKEQQIWGIAGEAKSAKRTIEIRMVDAMRFSPDRIDVRQGETIRFVLRNNGKLMHEMVIGTRKTLDEHAALMMKFPAMKHDEPWMTHVAPGKSGEIIWTFNRAGDFEFACLISGHYQAGMKGRIVVESNKTR